MLSQEQTQLVYGSLLGDANMNISGRCIHPRFCIRHSVNQAALVLAKYALLKDYTKTPPKVVENGGWGGPIMAFTTLTSPDFDKSYLLCYPRGSKRISAEWLSLIAPKGLAWWFMDDGSKQRTGVHLSTESFTRQENFALRRWLRGTWGLLPRVTHSRRNLWCLRFGKRPAASFCSLISQYVLPEMRYKLYLPASSICAFCGREFLPRRQPNSVCFSAVCQKAAQKRRMRRYYLLNRIVILAQQAAKRKPLLNRMCVVCGQPFQTNRPRQRRCNSPACAAEMRRFYSLCELNRSVTLEKWKKSLT